MKLDDQSEDFNFVNKSLDFSTAKMQSRFGKLINIQGTPTRGSSKRYTAKNRNTIFSKNGLNSSMNIDNSSISSKKLLNSLKFNRFSSPDYGKKMFLRKGDRNKAFAVSIIKNA